MGSTIQFKNPDQVEKTEQENTLKYEADNVTTLATTVDALVKRQNYKVEQKLNLRTKPKSSTPVGTSYPPFAMFAMSPIALQDDISATSAALPSEDHYTSANEAGALGPATNRCSFQ